MSEKPDPTAGLDEYVKVLGEIRSTSQPETKVQQQEFIWKLISLQTLRIQMLPDGRDATNIDLVRRLMDLYMKGSADGLAGS